MDEGRKPQRLTSQAGLLAGGRIAAAVVSAVWFVVLARTLSLGSFGSLALLLGLGAMTAVLTDLGLTGLLADVVAGDHRAARPGAAAVIRKRLVLGSFAACVTAVLYVTAGGEGGWWPPIAFAFSIVGSVFYTTDSAVFRAIGHAGIDGANELGSRLLVLVVGTVVVVAMGGGLFAVVCVYAAADIGSAIVLGIVLHRLTRHEAVAVVGSDLALRRARSLAMAGVVGTFYVRIDAWLLALLRGQRSVGRYAAAYRCYDALLLPASALASLSIPYTAGLTDRELRAKLGRMAGLAVAVTLPAALVAFVLAPQLIDVVFGPRYSAAVPALRILAVGALVSASIGSILPALALRSGRIAISLAVSLVANVIANLVLIPAHGPTGAAVATVGCEFALGAWIAFRVLRLGHAERAVATDAGPDTPPPFDRPKEPRVSVLIPVYNGEQYVSETIESALAQTWENLEIIVVDDGSTDGTAEALARYADRVVVVHQTNAGLGAARNRALSLATGDVVALLDGDDLWAPTRVERCIEVLTDRDGIDFVTTDAWLIDEASDLLGGTYLDLVPFPESDFAHEILRRNFVFVGVLVWKPWLTAVGGFATLHPMGAEDYDLWLALISRGATPGVVREPLASYRVRPDSLTRVDGGVEVSENLALQRQLPRYWKQGIYGPSGRCLRVAAWAARRGDLVTAARFVGGAFHDPDSSPWAVCTDAFRRARRRSSTAEPGPAIPEDLAAAP